MKLKIGYLVVMLVIAFSLVAVMVLTSPVLAQPPWYVDDDCTAPGTGTLADPFCKIQDAIDAASAGDTIIVAAGTYNEHDITINKSITIQGAGMRSTYVDGQDISRVFYIEKLNRCIVNVSGMTIQNGNTTGDGGGIYSDEGALTLTNCIISFNEANDGGGIAKFGGNLTMTGCWVSENIARENGGGIYNNDYSGEGLTMDNCTVSDNTAQGGEGGGIYNYSPLSMTDCTVSDNEAGDNGGGIYVVSGEVEMTGCTVSGNSASISGGGIYVDDKTTLTNCTVSGNSASDHGGGIINYHDELTLINCTISSNTATYDGGGIYNDYKIDELGCTIVYSNTAGSDGDDIYNNDTIDDPTDESIVGDAYDYPDGDTDPLLGPLQNNGGTTKTHALMIGSPAIDACIVSCNLTTDQRGLLRPVDGDLNGSAFCDVGAYEKQVAVGGIVEPIDKIGIVAPWLGLAVFMAAAIAVLVIMKRRRVA